MITDHYSLNSTVCALIILSYKHNSRKTASSNDVYHSIFRIFSVWYSHNSIVHSIKSDSVLVVHICVRAFRWGSVCSSLMYRFLIAHWVRPAFQRASVGCCCHSNQRPRGLTCIWSLVTWTHCNPDTHTYSHSFGTEAMKNSLQPAYSRWSYRYTHTHTHDTVV